MMAARIGLIVAGIALASRGVSLANGPTLVALTADGILLRFSADRPADVTMAKVTGASGQLVGLDRRPANGVLYGLTAVGDVYRVDPVSGAATLVSTLTAPFNGGTRAGGGFHPQTGPPRLGGARGPDPRGHGGNGGA